MLKFRLIYCPWLRSMGKISKSYVSQYLFHNFKNHLNYLECFSEFNLYKDIIFWNFFSNFLILGASSGIGAGTAIHFAKNGAKVSITGRNEENLKKIAEQCEEASPTKEKVTSLFWV